MLPMLPVRIQLGALLAADSTTLAPAITANQIALISDPFTPDENLVIGGLTLANFVTSTPLAGSTGAQSVAIDPATGDQVITIKVPAGGWRWVTTGLTNLPQTIYGFALTDSTGATLIGVAALPVPVTLTAIGQQVDLGEVTITFVKTPMS